MKVENGANALNVRSSDKGGRPEKCPKSKFQSLFGTHPERNDRDRIKEKQARNRDSRPSPQSTEENPLSLDPVNANPNRQPQFRPSEVEHVEAPRPTAPAAIVEGLVREISVVTSGERQEVRIQFDSRTLDGLQIQISKEDGNVSLQFVTSSMEVERILRRNLNELTENLGQRGVKLSSTRVERVTRKQKR